MGGADGRAVGSLLKTRSLCPLHVGFVEEPRTLTKGDTTRISSLSIPFGAGANDAARKAVQAAIDDMKADKPVFVGGVKDNRGAVISAKTLDLYDGSLWSTNYLIEGVIGSIT